MDERIGTIKIEIRNSGFTIHGDIEGQRFYQEKRGGMSESLVKQLRVTFMLTGIAEVFRMWGQYVARQPKFPWTPGEENSG